MKLAAKVADGQNKIRRKQNERHSEGISPSLSQDQKQMTGRCTHFANYIENQMSPFPPTNLLPEEAAIIS